MDLVKVAIGSKVITTSCKFEVGAHNKSVVLRYRFNSDFQKHEIQHEDILEMKYKMRDVSESDWDFVDVDDDSQLNFIAMRISPTDKNGLSWFTKSYLQEEGLGKEDPGKKYVVMEFRTDDEFKEIINWLGKEYGEFVNEDTRLDSAAAAKYATSLLKHTRKEKAARKESMGAPRKIQLQCFFIKQVPSRNQCQM
jgi:hypothetical protein